MALLNPIDGELWLTPRAEGVLKLTRIRETFFQDRTLSYIKSEQELKDILKEVSWKYESILTLLSCFKKERFWFILQWRKEIIFSTW